MLTPKKLRKGELIALVAPAKKMEKLVIDRAVSKFESEGFRVSLGDHVLKSDSSFAGSDEERLSDFQKALDNSEVKAIVCLRGGYGSMRIIDQLNWKEFKRKPKWICGFSDVTTFHAHCSQNLNISSLHASMPLNFDTHSDESWSSLIAALKGQELNYSLDSNPKNKTGLASSLIVGGNLSILNALRGTPYQLDLKGKILFIEEVGESFYHVDRMLQSIRLADEFSNLSGLIVGGMTKVEDNGEWFRDKSIEDLILRHLKPYSFPVAFDFPAGHIDDNRALILGKPASLAVGSSVHLSI